MKKRMLCVVIAFATFFLIMVPSMAQGLIEGLEVKDFSFQLKNEKGELTETISAGGTITANVTLENQTDSAQPYEMILQITDKGKKIGASTVSGRILRNRTKTEILCFVFPAEETDFSGYTAELFIWRDMNGMQPISMKAELDSDNTGLYGFRIDGKEIIFADENSKAEFGFADTYTGIPDIQAISEDLSAQVSTTDTVLEPTEGGQSLTYTIKAAGGAVKNWFLNIFRTNPKTDPKNANAQLLLERIMLSNGYSVMPLLDKEFDPEVTEYTVYVPAMGTIMWSQHVMKEPVSLTSVNPNATVTQTAEALNALKSTSSAAAVFNLTSEDGSKTKTYTFTYQLVGGYGFSPNSSTVATRGLNGMDADDTAPFDYWGSWFGYAQSQGILMDGEFDASKGNVKNVRTLYEIEVSGIPENANNIMIGVPITRNEKNNPFILHVYQASLPEGKTALSEVVKEDVHSCFGEQITAIPVSAMTAVTADVYGVVLDKNAVLAAKDAGKKLYIGLEAEAIDNKLADIRLEGGTQPATRDSLKLVRLYYN